MPENLVYNLFVSVKCVVIVIVFKVQHFCAGFVFAYVVMSSGRFLFDLALGCRNSVHAENADNFVLFYPNDVSVYLSHQLWTYFLRMQVFRSGFDRIRCVLRGLVHVLKVVQFE